MLLSQNLGEKFGRRGSLTISITSPGIDHASRQMEDSWINLQQQRMKQAIGQEEECEDVISGPSTESSASSTESIISNRPLTGSGTTDENLRAS